MDISSIVPETGPIVPEDKGGQFVSSDIALNAPETVAVIPDDQGRLLDNSFIRPSTPKAEMTVPEDYIASTASGVQYDQSYSASVPCNSEDSGQQTGKRDLFCPAINNGLQQKPRRKFPDLNRPEDLVEPNQDGMGEEYGEANPWISGLDDNLKRCSNKKRTLCCDGPSQLTQWVSNCFLCTSFLYFVIPTRPSSPTDGNFRLNLHCNRGSFSKNLLYDRAQNLLLQGF